MHSDSTVAEVLDNGAERPFPATPMRPMTEAEIEAAAKADPDAQPMSEEEWRTARRIPRIKTMRRALGLTQEEFSARYHVPRGMLRDWEQGRTEPDQPRPLTTAGTRAPARLPMDCCRFPASRDIPPRPDP